MLRAVQVLLGLGVVMMSYLTVGLYADAQGPLTITVTGQTGAAGPPGPAGPQGVGLPGPTGLPGTSVIVAALPVGDPNCPGGGARLTDGAGTVAYVCSAPPGIAVYGQ